MSSGILALDECNFIPLSVDYPIKNIVIRQHRRSPLQGVGDGLR